MIDSDNPQFPKVLREIERKTKAMGFDIRQADRLNPQNTGNHKTER